MEFSIFGFTLSRKKKDNEETKHVDNVVLPSNEEGTTDVISYGPMSGFFVEVYDYNIIDKDEKELIRTYRELSFCTEVDKAIEEVVNDAITLDETEPFPVKLNLEEVELSDNVKKKIIDEFTDILYMIGFNDNAHELFKEWYIDGRQYFYLIINKTQSKGIQKIIKIDPLYIKKVRNIVRDDNGKITKIEVFYVYKPENTSELPNQFLSYPVFEQGLKFTEDSITYSTSGLLDESKTKIVSHLHKAIKPANQLASLEDATVVYKVSRAPERRVFYIDVGNLPKSKAEEYIKSIMNRYRNRIAYNTKTGKLEDSKKYMSMLEDFWLPRRDSGKGTEIDTLPGGTLGDLDDLAYFRHKLYESLNVPVGRIDSENAIFNLGKESEITREEIKFSKFINRLRNRYAKTVFSDILKKQLILKKILTENDWNKIERKIKYKWEDDSHFAEMKKLSVLRERLDLVDAMDQMIDKYYSTDYIRYNILMQTEEEVKELEKQRDEDKKKYPQEDEMNF